MQNPKAIQSKLGMAVSKGMAKGVLKTSMRGAASALFDVAKNAAKEVPGQRRADLRHAVDDNRREKLKNEIKDIDEDVLAYQKQDLKRFLRRAALNGDWVHCCKACYAATVDWGDGRAGPERGRCS